MLTAIFLLAAVAQPFSDRDRYATLMYMQALTLPQSIELCKTAIPDQATALDEAFAKRLKHNKKIIEEGNRVVHEQAKREDIDVDANSKIEQEQMISAQKTLLATEQVEVCNNLLILLENGVLF